MQRAVIVAWVVSAMIAWSSLASAQALELDWSAPAACPDASSVRASTERLLARSHRAASVVRASGRVTRAGKRWTLLLSIDVHQRRATRNLSAESCATLADAAAWLVAVAVDPDLPPPVEDASPAASEAEATAEPSATPSATSNAPAQAPAPTERDGSNTTDDLAELTWHLGVYSGAFAGGLAGPNPSLGARLSAELRGWSAELSFAHHFEMGMKLATPPQGESEFSAQELALAGCYAWGSEVRLGPCAVVSLLRVQGNVDHIALPESASAFWSTGGLSIALGYRGFAPWELFADGGLWLSLSKRPRFEVEALGSVGEGASVGGRVRIGVGISLP